MSKVITLADGEDGFLEKFDAIVRAARDAAKDPEVPVDVRYEKGEESSVLTITIQNLQGQFAKEERENRARLEDEARAATVATREARAKAKRNAKNGVKPAATAATAATAKASVVEPVALEPVTERWVPPGQEHSKPTDEAVSKSSTQKT